MEGFQGFFVLGTCLIEGGGVPPLCFRLGGVGCGSFSEKGNGYGFWSLLRVSKRCSVGHRRFAARCWTADFPRPVTARVARPRALSATNLLSRVADHRVVLHILVP